VNDNVVSLVDRLSEPNADVVDKLRWLLTKAERGEIINFAWATVEVGDDTGSGFAQGPKASALMGAVTLLHHGLAHTLHARTEDLTTDG
jgi:hypothetical protein